MNIQNISRYVAAKVKVNEIELYYKYYQCNEKSPNLVMMAGLTRDHQIWGEETITQLSKSFNIIIFDNRGTGQSSMPQHQYNIENLADDVIGLIDALNIKNTYVLGHSMGGFAMQYVAYKIPEKIKGMLLFSTAMKQSEFAIKYLQKRLTTLDKGLTLEDSVKIFIPMLYADSFVTDDLLSIIVAKEKSNPYPQSIESLKMQIMACLNHDSSFICNKINIPTIVVTGAEDKITDIQRANVLAQNIKNAKLVLIPNVGHMIQIEAQQQFCEIINKFINETEEIEK